jgi:hypothetical protein
MTRAKGWSRTLNRRSPDDRFPSNKKLELSQKRALALVRLRRINCLRHNDAGLLTRSFTALNGNV